jgi:D-lactate dehydrogenase
MKTAVFSTKSYEAKFLVAPNASAGHELDFFKEKLSPHTARLAEGHTAICALVYDILNARTLDVLDHQNVRFVALRCAGFNQVDLRYASSLGIKIAHVPAYSPYAVAEFALALALNRRIHRAYNRVRDGNFSIDGLFGFDLVTSHQAYFTDQALENISDTTVANLTAFERGDTLVNEVTLAMLH